MIRDATVEDIPFIVDLGRKFAAITYPEIDYDPETTAASLRGLIDSEAGVLLVSERGMIGAVLFPMFFNAGHLHCQEMFWWDEGGEGRALLRALEARARERGARTITMVCLDDIRPGVFAKLYTRAGYRPAERFFIKGIG